MPSEHRLHPATLLFDLAKHVKNFAVPALLVIFGASRSSGGPGGSFGNVPAGWEAWLLVLFVPATIASIARYLSFRLRYEGDELVIKSGLFFRRERHVPFSRIQNVDAIQNIFHRLFSVVEVRVETGGGKEEEARLSVLPHAAFLEIRDHVFARKGGTPESRGGTSVPPAPESSGGTLVPPSPESSGGTLVPPIPLLHLPLRELLLCGFLENKGMVMIAAAYGAVWELGLGRLFTPFIGDPDDRSFIRDVAVATFRDGTVPIGPLLLLLAGIPLLLLFVRALSMIWALVRLYDFRLTRVGEDLRIEYGLFTKVTATVPIRRVQMVMINAGPLHRWLKRATVRVATAGGAGTQGASHAREWLAPLIRQEALPNLLQHVVPGFDINSVDWQPVHPRAFARAIKPALIVPAAFTLASAFLLGWGAIGVLIVMLLWTIFSTRQYVAYLGWADGDEVVAMRSGWIWQRTTLARVNKIQVVSMHQTPFDRRAAMARVRVDTAGEGELSHRVDIPYLDDQIADALTRRLSEAAASTAFRW